MTERKEPTQPGRSSLSHARKAGELNATGLSAHRLAGEPGTPVRFTFRAPPRIRTGNLLVLGQATLPIGLEGQELRAVDRLRTGDLQLGELVL